MYLISSNNYLFKNRLIFQSNKLIQDTQKQIEELKLQYTKDLEDYVSTCLLCHLFIKIGRF